MLFNSLQFLIFLPIVVFVYFSLASRFRWVWLLASSYFFYMSWNPKYALLILLSTAITYVSGILIAFINETEIANKIKSKKLIVGISFVANISILVFFKYFNFLSKNISIGFEKIGIDWQNPYLDILLPIGISFYTFQALSYTMDVYRGDIKPEKHFGRYALFVSFFPQLVAGPIERSTNLLPQFREEKIFDIDKARDGIFIMLFGFFKKIVIADRLAVLVNTVYNDPSQYDGYTLIIATIFFAFQIYCDFSAYSDIAIGAAKIMGYDLMQNFDKPYFSKSISQFWRKWHISLSSWFKDYLYIPLGGSRKSTFRRYINVLLVFVISGFWHGASWNFVIWGALHGVYLLAELALKPLNEGLIKTFNINRDSYGIQISKILITFSFVCIAWVFFRANTLKDSIFILQNFFNINSFKIENVGLDKFDVNLSIGLILLIIIIQLMERKHTIREILYAQNRFVRWGFLILLVNSIVFWGYYPTEPTQFIYFQF